MLLSENRMNLAHAVFFMGAGLECYGLPQISVGARPSVWVWAPKVIACCRGRQGTINVPRGYRPPDCLYERSHLPNLWLWGCVLL